MLNPILGSAKVKNAYYVWYREIFNMADKILQQMLSTLFCYSLDFHNISHAFLLFYSISQICEALF